MLLRINTRPSDVGSGGSHNETISGWINGADWLFNQV